MDCPKCGHQFGCQGWEVRCVECGQLKWPYLPERPDPETYVCTLCRSSSATPEQKEVARARGKAAAAAKARLRQLRNTQKGVES